MRTRDTEQYINRKNELMEKSYECFAENGLSSVGIRALAKHCNCNSSLFYSFFSDLDDLIIQSTAHCMSKVEEDFMSLAPQDPGELERFIDEIPYWTAKTHGKKYRLMYQVYTHPKYREHGKTFFKGVNYRYTEYAKNLESKIGIPCNILRPMIFVFVRACVHYALYEDDFYLQEQLRLLKYGIHILKEQKKSQAIKSFTTSDAIIRPATDGTNAFEPGI